MGNFALFLRLTLPVRDAKPVSWQEMSTIIDRTSPVWERVSASLDPAARLLVVIGPRGSGRRRIAGTWLEGAGQLVDFSEMPPGTTPADAVRRVLTVLEDSGAARVAAILPPVPQAFELALRPDAQLLRGPDLFLTVPEVERLAAELGTATALSGTRVPGPAAKTPEQLWRLTGGWLYGVETLLKDPGAEMELANVLGRAIAPWVAYVDPEGLLPEAAFLPFFSEDMLQAFYGQRVDRVPGLAQLVEACLIHRSPDGDWIMPDLARSELRASLQRRSPDRAEQLDALAVSALAEVSEPGAAVLAAVERRAWRGLWSVLEEHWVDMFMSNPRMLRYAAQKMPARFARSDLFTAALKILAAAGKDRMNVPFPAAAPVYGQDRTAQNLRRLTEQQFRRPNAFAVTAGLVELSFLRIQGHYEESGQCGERLRRVVSEVAAAERVRPVMAGMAELHCGISLHIADRLIEAANAYEAAMHWGACADNAFVQANAAANLALVHAQAGNTQSARDWADRADTFLPRTKWGTKMVGRGARLARVYIAWHELDRAKMEAALKLLPPEPDNDEFWPVHAELLTLWERYFGSADAGLHRLNDLRSTRKYAAQSPLAVRTLGHAEFVARVSLDPLAAPRKPADSPELRNLQAYLAIQTGDTDAALAVLQRTLSAPEGGWRIRCIARNLQLLASVVPGPLGADALETVRTNYAAGGEPIDLLWLWQEAQNREGLREALGLTNREIRRLDTFAVSRRGRVEDRMSLTDRELEVLAGLRLGKTRMQMAAERHVSVNTVKAQTTSLYRKLGVTTRHEALQKAKLWGY